MINYQLKRKDISKPQPIFAYITGVFIGSKERLKISIGKSILPQDFGEEIDNYKFNRDRLNKSKKPSNLIVKSVIDKFELTVNQVDLFFNLIDIKPTREEFKVKLLEYLGREVKEIKVTSDRFIDFIEDYINNVKNIQKKNMMKISDDTIRNYLSIIYHIKNYEKYKERVLNISDISYDIYNDFIDTTAQFSVEELKGNNRTINCRVHNKVCKSNNTISVIASRFRFFLEQASKRGYQLHKILNLSDERLVINMQPSSKDYYFSHEFLNNIYNYQPKSKSAVKGKDYIMLASTTGMRFQGVKKLYEQIPQLITTNNGSSFFIIKNKAKKTGIELLSPLMKPAIEVYERLGEFPRLSTANMVNYQIRALFREMELEKKVTMNYHTYGDGVVKVDKLLSDVVSSHDLRASFITNLLNLQVDRFKVQAMTHKAMNDGTAFSVYDKRSEIDRAIEFYEATKDINSEFYRYK